jgi:hypothetical protein
MPLDTPIPAPRAAPRRPDLLSPFVPLLLLAVSLLTWFAFQSWQLAAERQQLQKLAANLQPQIEQANQRRMALDRLALATRQLAGQGNANARVIVDELRRRGVTINQSPPPPPE